MHQYSQPFTDSDTNSETGPDPKFEKGKSQTLKLLVTKYLLRMFKKRCLKFNSTDLNVFLQEIE